MEIIRTNASLDALKAIRADDAVDRLTKRLLLNGMKDRLRRLRMARHCLVRSHAADVDLLPATLTEVVEAREVTAEEIAGGRLAHGAEPILQMRLDLQTLEETRSAYVN